MSIPSSLPTREEFHVHFKVFNSTKEIPTLHKRSIAIFKEMGVSNLDGQLQAEVERLDSIIARKGERKCEALMFGIMMTALVAGAILMAAFMGPLFVLPCGIPALFPMGCSFGLLDFQRLTSSQKAAMILTLGLATPFVAYAQEHKARDPKNFVKEEQAILQRMQKFSIELEKHYPDLKDKLQKRMDSADAHYSKESARLALEELEKCKSYYSQFRGGK